MALSNRSSAGRTSRNSGGMGLAVFGVAALLLAGGAGGVWYFMRPSAPRLAADGGAVAAPAPAIKPQVDGATAPATVAAPQPVATPAPVVPAPAPPAANPAPPVANAPGAAAPGSAYTPPAAPAQPIPQTGHVQEELAQGVALIDAGKVVEGRAILSEILFNYTADLKPENAAWIRAKLTDINGTFVYGKRNLSGDDITALYTVKSGDSIEKIANKYRVPSGILLQISGMKSAKSLQVGQKLKTVLGPVQARLVKHEYRMDLYVQNANGAKIYLKSFAVGLGADDKTPVGKFRIGAIEGDTLRGKMENPPWTDPETGKKYEGGAADNPIGKYWIPLQGQETANAALTGYGIHGTIDPASIGQNKSHGCVRLVESDIQEIYHTLFCGKSVFSTLEILP